MSPSSQPAQLTLSVITPSFNYEHFVGDCLDSVRLQEADGVDVQHIVVDDGSRDGSWEVICARHEGAPTDRVRQTNVGLSATLNRALQQASGEWVLWLNADDFLLPRTFEFFARSVSLVPEASLVFGDTLFIDDAARLRRLVAQPSFDRRLFEGGYNSFHVPSVLWSRRLMGSAGLNESMKLLMDLDLWLEITPPREPWSPRSTRPSPRSVGTVTRPARPRGLPTHRRCVRWRAGTACGAFRWPPRRRHCRARSFSTAG